MTSRLALALVVLIAAAPTPAAIVSSTKIEQTGPDLTVADTQVLSEAELARSRLWGMSEMEWRRYTELMHGIRGSISPANISPIEVLGIHARDAAERRHYAEMWVRAMREDASRILAFQHAYDEAGKRLYPNQLLIDVDKIPNRTDTASVLKIEDRVLYFTRSECPACDALLQKLIKRLDEIAGIDIYLTDVPGTDDRAVRAWAKDHRIAPGFVRDGRITLNHDGGALKKLTQGKGDPPYLLIRRDQELMPLDAVAL